MVDTTGFRLPRVDLRAKVLGQATYGIDVRLSGTAYGAVAYPQPLKESYASGGRGCLRASAGVLKFLIIGLAVSLMGLNMARVGAAGSVVAWVVFPAITLAGLAMAVALLRNVVDGVSVYRF